MRIETEEERRSLGRLLVQNQKAFVLNNIMRTREMLQYASPGFRAVFQNTPYFLQVNRHQTPGFVQDGDSARGIYGFERSGFARLFKEKHRDRSLKEVLVLEPVIQSLMLIGSTGSIGHTSTSDLDYWVCLDDTRLSKGLLESINEKLHLISRWAREKHNIEVHFFPMETEKVRLNQSGMLDEDNSGDVMPLLIKEEFYRTALHVAGKMPLWWIVPEGITKDDYKDLAGRLQDITLTTFQPDDFLDLGFPEQPGPKEYLGAAMWQVHKAKRDPFKALLKMAVIQEQVEHRFERPLLCDAIKKNVLQANPGDLPVDPYLLTIRRTLDYAAGRPELEEMVRVSAWFKLLAPYKGSGNIGDKTRKMSVIREFCRDWDWREEKIKTMMNYANWPFRKKLALGNDLKEFLLEMYSYIASELRFFYPEEVKVENDNLTRLNARIIAGYARHQDKIDELPYDAERLGLPRDLVVFWNNGRWQLLESGIKDADVIYETGYAGRIPAWLIQNSLYHDGLTLRYRPCDQAMKLSALLSLLKLLGRLFPPAPLNSSASLGLLAEPVGPVALLVNMESASSSDHIETAEIAYRNSIGEMFHEVIFLPETSSDYAAMTVIADELLTKRGIQFSDIRVFAPPGPAEDWLVGEVGDFLEERSRSQADADKGRKVKLDRYDEKPADDPVPKARLDLD